MQCPHAPDIKVQPLSPGHTGFLRNFINRWRIDPGFVTEQVPEILLSKPAVV